MCEERTFTWFPKITRVMQALPPENVAEFAMAVAEYGTNGTAPEFSSPILAAVFEGIREDIDNSVNARHRNKGGRPKRKACENGGSEVSETQETPVLQNENQFQECKTPVTGFENMGEEVSETENPSYINQTKPNQDIPSQDIPSQDKPGHLTPEEEGERFAIFAKACIDAFNEETGKDYRSNGGTDWLDLRRIYDTGRTVDDVRAVVRAKCREWGHDPKWSKFIRPSTLFGRKFEEYLAEGIVSTPSRGDCPECGHPLVPITDVLLNPKDPTKLWCSRCKKAVANG